MAPSKRTFVRLIVILAAAGGVLLLAVTWWASSLYQSSASAPAEASAAFAGVRARFPGVDPAFEIREARLVVMREPATTQTPSPATASHMLVWRPRDRTLSRITLPPWMSRVATEPLPLEALAGIASGGIGGVLEAKRRGDELNIRLTDLQRYGRTLLLDGVTPDGNRVMMWNE